ncbi:Protein kinase-like domain [Phytophthora cactorum]|nr:Protein kinase-like domain [Phytophthora cactorum]
MLSSMSHKIAARYECDGKEVPRVLWRVRYTGQSLKARAKPAFKTKKQFKRAVELHLNWSNRIPTPFVALFGTREHAVNWAKSHFELGYDDVFLLKIDASKLGPIFQVRYLVQDSDIHTLLPESMYNDEFLVLRKITRRKQESAWTPTFQFARPTVSLGINSEALSLQRNGFDCHNRESLRDDEDVTHLGRVSHVKRAGVNFAACQTKKQLELLDWTSMETDCTKTEWTTLFEDLRDFTNQEEAAVSIVLDDVSALKWQFGDAAVLDFVRCCKTLTHENNVSVTEAGDLVHFPAIADMATVVLSTKPLSTGYSKDIHGTLPIRRSDIELTTVCIALGRMRCLTEVELLKQLPTHPNIVGFREAFWMQHLDETQQLLVLVLELADGGDLEQYLRGSSIKEEEARRIFLQIAQGVNHLHRHRVIHRDLKSGNVFLFGSGRVVLGDFGTSKLLPTTAGADQFLEAQGLTSTVVGSPLFMSPELLEGESHGFATDIWSLGCVLYEMLSGGKPAFCAPSYPAVVFRITQGKYDPLDTTLVSSEARDLVDKILRKDPKNRPNITEVLQLPWLQAPNTRNEGSPADHLPAKGVITAMNCQETIAGQQEMNSDVLESSILKPTTLVAQSNTPPAAPVVNKIEEVSPPPVPQTLDEQPPPPPILPSKANFSTVSSIPFKHHHLQHHRQTIPGLEIRGVHITGTARHNSAYSIPKS